ncbi:MAG: mRNA surveillance protein pelota [Candidatus Bathyarchaeota archaeon]|nr:mRNA surveillance protein pelota [Candidatus Bathyarchaeota archaeon]
MKVLEKDLKHGRVTVIPEFLEDFWVLYTVIQKGDVAYARTTREVRSGERYERSEKGKRISVFLGLKVESVYWDRSLNRLRVHGVVCDAPEDIGAMGSHHTFNITLNTRLTIIKKRWLDYHVRQIERAASGRVPPIIVMSIDDEGYCAATLSGDGLNIVSEEHISLPGKHMADERQRVLNEMFKSALRVLEDLVKSLDGSIVVVGVGFVKEMFMGFLRESQSNIYDKIIDVKSVNSAGRSGIYEAMRSGILSKALQHIRVVEEASAVEEVLKRLGAGRGDVTYGLSEVERAVSLAAVEEILVTDELIRGSAEDEMLLLEGLIRSVEDKGGKVRIISVEHEAGAKLKALGGIAALLRFPIS